jgi:uncharacterized protein (DUF2141 family)
MLPFKSDTHKLSIEIAGIRNDKGTLRIGVFMSQEGFRDEKPEYEFSLSKAGLENGRIALQIELPAGKYGISVLDDENSDGRMNYNLLGIPREGFGFSGYISRGMKKPRFSDFSFDLRSEVNVIKVRMRYVL